MAEMSYWWTTGGAGDGAATYTRVNLQVIAQILAACYRWQGVAKDFMAELLGTAGSASVDIATGGAVVDGKPYYNGAVVTVSVPAAVGLGNTRIDRIVLRADWTAQTVRITRIAGIDAGTPSVPALTQTSGTTYDLPLYQALVNTSGVVTLTDEREFAELGADAVEAGMLADGAVDATDVLADGIVTAAKIANRTRRFLVTPVRREPPASGYAAVIAGLYLQDSVESVVLGYFAVPNDFVSGMTVKAVVISNGTGNLYCLANAAYGAENEAYNTHQVNGSYAAVAVTANQRNAILSMSLSSAAGGDLVSVEFSRNGASGSDTVNSYMQFFGWLVEYTADS